MKMSFAEIKQEWEYAYNERLGIMCESRDPTPDEERAARLCADAHIQRVVYGHNLNDPPEF